MKLARDRAGRFAVVAAVCGLAAAGSARAQIAPLQAPPAEGATSVSPDVVLRRADWIVYAPLDVEDLLRRVAGVSLVRNGGTGSLEYAGLLGSVSGRVQVTLDGLAVTDVEFALPRLLAIPLGSLDRVEIFRSTEPARIAFYSRESDETQPVFDADLSRGDFGERTRRVQFFTPPRPVTVALSYDEALRDAQDFRTDQTTPPADNLGAADERSLAARIDLQRGAERVRFAYRRTNANAHGTLFDDADALPAQSVRTRLRWERPGARVQSIVEVAHQAWDEPRVFDTEPRTLRSARTTAAVDLGTGGTGAWTAWLRARGDEMSADGVPLRGTTVHRRVRAERAEIEVGRTGTLRMAAAGGAHHDARAGTAWSASGMLGTAGETWSLAARGGRGVEFAGIAEVDTVRRRGDHAVLELTRRTPTLELRLQAFAKRFQDRFAAGSLAWNLGGLGLQRAVGTAFDMNWTRAGRRWLGGAQASAAYVPHRNGDPGGLAELQGTVHARAGVRLFSDDLIVQGSTGWVFEGERRFGAGPVLGSTALGEVLLNVQVLQRLHVYFGAHNVTNAEVVAIPGVRRPERLTFGGFRVRLLD